MPPLPPMQPPELSRLAYADRILEEASDDDVPVLDRVRRVGEAAARADSAWIRGSARLRKKANRGGRKKRRAARRRLAALETAEAGVRTRCDTVLRDLVRPALGDRGVRIVEAEDLDALGRSLVRTLFEHELAGRVRAVVLPAEEGLGSGLWLVAGSRDPDRAELAAVSLPPDAGMRFLSLPETGGQRTVLFAEDVLRANMDRLFPSLTPGTAYLVRILGDAPGPVAVRYDRRMPYALMRRLMDSIGLDEDVLVEGHAHLRLGDLTAFPTAGLEQLGRDPWRVAAVREASGMFASVVAGDRLFRYPYESHDAYRRLLAEAAVDPSVVSVSVTLPGSELSSDTARALSVAAGSGKRVSVFIDAGHAPAHARLVALTEAGVRIVEPAPGHLPRTALCWIEREERIGRRGFAYLETGRRHDQVVRPASSYGLLTADRRLTDDVRRLLHALTAPGDPVDFTHLMLAPDGLRAGLKWLIRTEETYAADGRPAGLRIQTYRLEDRGLIRRLVSASTVGVPVQIAVQESTRLGSMQGGPLVVSAVDRIEEQAGIVWCRNGGDPACFLMTADWTRADLRDRFEIAIPVLDPAIRSEIGADLDRRFADGVKGGRIAGDGAWLRSADGPTGERCQESIWRNLVDRQGNSDGSPQWAPIVRL